MKTIKTITAINCESFDDAEFKVELNDSSIIFLTLYGYESIKEAVTDQLGELVPEDDLVRAFVEIASLYTDNKPAELDTYIEGDLQLIEVTKGRNGYPSGLYKAVIGFDDMQQAKDFAAKCGGVTAIFHKRDGCRFWDCANLTNEPIDNTIGLDGCYYDNGSDAIDILEELKKELIAEDGDEPRLKIIEKNIQTIKEEWQEGMIVNMYDGDYIEVIPKYTMGYYEDCHTFEIGVRRL